MILIVETQTQTIWVVPCKGSRGRTYVLIVPFAYPLASSSEPLQPQDEVTMVL